MPVRALKAELGADVLLQRRIGIDVGGRDHGGRALAGERQLADLADADAVEIDRRADGEARHRAREDDLDRRALAALARRIEPVDEQEGAGEHRQHENSDGDVVRACLHDGLALVLPGRLSGLHQPTTANPVEVGADPRMVEFEHILEGSRNENALFTQHCDLIAHRV